MPDFMSSFLSSLQQTCSEGTCNQMCSENMWHLMCSKSTYENGSARLHSFHPELCPFSTCFIVKYENCAFKPFGQPDVLFKVAQSETLLSSKYV